MSISILNRGASGGLTASIKVNGLGVNDTVTASNGSKTVSGKWMPSGYTQLEYIESTGTQWIDTQLKVQTGYTAKVDFQLTKKPTNAVDGYIEAWILASTYEQGFRCGIASGGSAFYTNSNFSYSQTADLLARTVATGTCPQNNTTNTYLFRQNHEGSPCINNAYFKLFSCKIADASGNLVRDFVPCTNPSGEVGLYDLVNGVFYGNSGTGEFVAGADVQPLLGYHEINGIKDKGMWTITATNGTRTKTRDVLIEAIGLYEIEMVFAMYTDFASKDSDWTETGGSFNYGNGIYVSAGGAKGTITIGSDLVKTLEIPVSMQNDYFVEYSDILSSTNKNQMGSCSVRLVNDGGTEVYAVSRLDGWADFNYNTIGSTGGEVVTKSSTHYGSSVTHRIEYSNGVFSYYLNGTLKNTLIKDGGEIVAIRIYFTGAVSSSYPQAGLKISYLDVAEQ